MKLIIYVSYGYFYIPDEIIDYIKKNSTTKEEFDYSIETIRTNKYFMEWIENQRLLRIYCPFNVIEIPNGATDYKIMEYDGVEYIIYVLDGKIFEIY